MATPQQTPPGELNLKQLLTVLGAYRKGDFSARKPNDLLGLPGKVADNVNAMASTLTGQVHAAKPPSVVALQT